MKLTRAIALAGSALLVVASVLSLMFWARLPGRLPTDADYQRANAVIRDRLQTDDVIVLAPSWADRGRPFLTAAPVYAGYDLKHDEYRGSRRQWLVALANAPRFSLDDARAELLARGSSAAPGERIGALWVEPFAIGGPDVAFSFTEEIAKAAVSIDGARVEPCRKLQNGGHQCPRGDWNKVQPGWFEVKEQPVHCLWAHPVDNGAVRISFGEVPAGKLRGWAALVGQAADGGAPVEIGVDVDGQFAQQFSFPSTPGKQPFEFQLPVADGTRRLDFVVTAASAGRRHFCFDAWIERQPSVTSQRP